MVEPKKPQYKSLGADAELNSAYDYLYHGEFSNCARIIKKRFPKLKSPIDIANFNILNLLLLHRTKKSKEKNELIKKLKTDFTTKAELYTNAPLVKHFKSILRNFDDDQGIRDIIKVQMKSKNLATFTPEEQNSTLKEYALNYDFTDLYSKSNSFIKSPNGANVKFLKLVKYEAVFYSFLNKKLSENMTKKVYKEMLDNYDELKKEKGFLDIIAQFTLALNDKEKFIEIFIQKKEEGDFTNAPIEDYTLEIYFSQRKIFELIRDLYSNIKANAEKLNFSSFERIINALFWYINKNGLKADINKFDTLKDNVVEKISELNNIENLIEEIFSLFEHIKANSGKNLNAFKSGVFGQLMLYHNLIILNKTIPDKIKKIYYDLIISLLDKAVHKQSILFEIGKYLIYLDQKERDELLLKYSNKRSITLESYNSLTDKTFDDYLFLAKLTKMLTPKENITEESLNKIIYTLIKVYLFINQTITKGIKLEKGERNIADDLIILANEYFYEAYSLNSYPDSLSYALLYINLLSHEQSPYNYDISIYLLLTYSLLEFGNGVLDTLKYMNLKGPQFESVSYISFPCFINFKQGMNYLVDNSERWQNDNRRNTKKTMWKMFNGRNFWSTRELVDFLYENKNSYYVYLLQFFDILNGLISNYLNINGKEEENEKDLFEYLMNLYNSFQSMRDKVVRNQDMFIVMHKYKASNYTYFNNNYSQLECNVNYDRSNYRLEIDTLNKEKNCLYNLYPSYKNNFLKQCGYKPFLEYDSYDYFNLKMLEMVVISKLDNITQLKEFIVKYITQAKENKSEIDQLLGELITFMIASFDDIDNFINKQEDILNLLSKFDEMVISKLNLTQKDFSYANFSSIAEFIRLFNQMKYFVFIPFTNVVSKFIDLITEYKKEISEPNKVKAKFNEKYKSPLINVLKEIEKKMDMLIGNCHKEGYLGLNAEDVIAQFNEGNDEEKEKTMKKGDDIRDRIDEGHKDVFKEIKEGCKRVQDYIKQMI